VFVINTAALVILGILLLRKVVLMERYFEVRVFLITAFLCGVFLFLVVSLFAYDVPGCTPPPPGMNEFYICPEY
jgi:hypothetical protein